MIKHVYLSRYKGKQQAAVLRLSDRSSCITLLQRTNQVINTANFTESH